MSKENFKINGAANAPIVVVGGYVSYEEEREGKPFAGKLGKVVLEVMSEAGFYEKDIVFINGYSKSRSYGETLTPAKLKDDAKEHLIPFINAHPRKLVIAMGNDAACCCGITEKPEGISAVKGKLSYSKEYNYPTVATANAVFLVKNPHEYEDFLPNLRFAHKVYRGDLKDNPDVHIIDLDRPSQIETSLYVATKFDEFMAYDLETTDLNRMSTQIVTQNFSNLLQTEGKQTAWFWGGYDKLQPRYEQHVLDEFKEAFDWFYSLAGKDYALISHNGKSFDDWVIETYLGHRFEGSQFDTRLMKWAYNTKRPHGLKDSVAKYLGYPDYEAGAYAQVKAVSERRGKTLVDSMDFHVLERFGFEPEKTKSGLLKWPKGVDKKLAAYALIDFDILRLYGVLDAVHTRNLFEFFSEGIEEENLHETIDNRHRIAEEFLRCEQRGMLLDVKTNRDISDELKKIEEQADVKIQDEVFKIDPTFKDFNPGSDDHLRKILFGEPTMLPVIARGPLYEKFDKNSVDQKVDSMEMKYYEDFDGVIEAVHENVFDYESTKQGLVEVFKKKFKGVEVAIENKPYYFKGIYEPSSDAYTKTGKPSVSRIWIESYYERNPQIILQFILMRRKAKKLRGTFVDGVYDKRGPDDAIRCEYNLTGVEGERCSSKGPNLQNIAKGLKGLWIPREGYNYVDADLSAAEVRVAGAISGDANLIEALNAADIYRATAEKLYGIPADKVDDALRQKMKIGVLAGLYGASAFRLSAQFNNTVDESQDYLDGFYDTFPDVKKWQDETLEIAGRAPYCVRTPSGLRINTRGLLSSDEKVRRHWRNVAINAPIQGASGALTFYYICEIMDRARKRKWDVYFVNTVHDSMTFECSKKLSWREDSGKRDNEGNIIWQAAGPFIDLIREVVGEPAPIPPLDKVKFKIDIDVNDRWSGKEVNAYKAIDPKYGKDDAKIRFDLLPKELKGYDPEADNDDEFDEMEEAYYSE